MKIQRSVNVKIIVMCYYFHCDAPTYHLWNIPGNFSYQELNDLAKKQKKKSW